MSCHDVGRALNSVTEVVIQMYDNAQISREQALTLFTALKKGVNWCDGNEPEAIASIFCERCGNCLRKMNEGEKFYSMLDCHSELRGKFRELYKKDHASWYFCTECFDKIVQELSNGKIKGESERKYIEENQSEENFTIPLAVSQYLQ